jgi:hypothetical protein
MKNLSCNSGIVWSDDIIQDNIGKIDFWLIALYGKVDPDLVIKYAAYFDESREVDRTSRRNSDGQINITIFANGWQNLLINKHFNPSLDFVEFAINREIRIYDSFEHWESIKSEINPSEVAQYTKISVYDLFRNKFKSKLA